MASLVADHYATAAALTDGAYWMLAQIRYHGGAALTQAIASSSLTADILAGDRKILATALVMVGILGHRACPSFITIVQVRAVTHTRFSPRSSSPRNHTPRRRTK